MAAKKAIPALDNANAQGERKDIPYSQLFLSPFNVRRTTPTMIDTLAALILGQGGIVQNLVVYPELKDGKPTGRYGVAGGGRRWRAVGQLVKAKQFDKDHPMPSLITTEDKAIELSIVENSGDEPMHPADEFEAFKALIDSGRDIKDVAALYGITENTVYRRLRLANVAPSLIDKFRNGEEKITLGDLEALALTTDHDMQIRVWSSLPHWQQNPRGIRAAIMNDKINIATSPIGIFVGVEAFEAAGGVIERDLFSDKGDGYVADISLLNQLAQDKLEAAAQPYRDNGTWAWVEVVGLLDYQKLNEYGRAKTKLRKPTAEEKKNIEQLESELEQVRDQMAKMEEADEDGSVYQNDEYHKLNDREGTLSEAVEEAESALMVVLKDHKKYAGVLVGINPDNGALKVELGRIKPEEKRAAFNIGSSDEEAAQKVKPNHSERLIRQLTAQRTAALQEAVAANPNVAIAALATQLFLKTLSSSWYQTTCIGISTQSAALDSNGGEVIRSDRAYILMNERCEKWESRLVGDGCTDATEIYERIASLPQEDLNELLALCTARTIDTISGTDNRLALTNLLMNETSLDMADWWQPKAENYFNHVSKTRTLEVISTVVPADTLESLGKMKKGALAEAAEKAMEGQRGLPSEMMAQ